MNDILKVALDRRAELHEEVTRIEDFIRMADKLLRHVQPVAEPVDALPASGQAPPAVRDMTPGVTRMNLMRRPAAAVG